MSFNIDNNLEFLNPIKQYFHCFYVFDEANKEVYSNVIKADQVKENFADVILKMRLGQEEIMKDIGKQDGLMTASGDGKHIFSGVFKMNGKKYRYLGQYGGIEMMSAAKYFETFEKSFNIT